MDEDIIKLLENSNIKIPDYLQKLMIYTGYDNSFSMSNFTQNDITNIQNFVKDDLPHLINDETELKQFYGIYFNNKNMYKIPDGHKKLLLNLAEICKKEISFKSSKRRSMDQNLCDSCKKNKSFESTTSVSDISIDTNAGTDEQDFEIPENAKEKVDIITKHKTHIVSLCKNYISSLIKSVPLEVPEQNDNQNLDLNIDQRAENGVYNLENVAKLQTSLQFHVEIIGERYAKVKCPICDIICKVSSKEMKSGRKWILSNFNKHIKSHMINNEYESKKNCRDEFKQKSKKKLQMSLMSFLKPKTNVIPKVIPDATIESSIESIPEFEHDFVHETSMQILEDRSFDNININVEADDEFICQSQKWKDKKYSRQSRKNRSLEVVPPVGQRMLTDFYSVIQDLKVVLNDNSQTRESILSSVRDKHSEIHRDINGLLEFLKTTAENNIRLNKHSHKFTESVKLFALYIFLIGGRLLYENLHANLNKSLPSITTIYRTLDESCKISEGEINFEKLKEFLVKRNLPLNIFISEDQTAIIKRVQYDAKSNKMVGFLQSLTKTGFPETDTFILNSVRDAEAAFKNNELSSNAYVFMAQPLVDKAPAFCIVIFGTDNRFNFEDVLNRWEYLENEASKYGICIEGFASDGDTRCLKAMKIRSKLNSVPVSQTCPYKPYFLMDFNTESPVFFQDTVHIGTKLKTRFLKENINLPIGTFFISPNHIEDMMKMFTKDKHNICPSFLQSFDKMNFDAIDKLSSFRVLDLLKHVPERNGTRQYLYLTGCILDAFLCKNIAVSKRIYNMWYSIFFIRLWRQWILDTNYSIQKNCITLNTYTCIELNGNSLLSIIEKFKAGENPELFLPWLFSSQPCEKIFRKTRSMTTTFSTVVNFSLLEILQRMYRIQILNDISTDLGESFHFPREENVKLGYSKHGSDVDSDNNICLPSTEEISDILNTAKNDAITDAEGLGIVMLTKSKEDVLQKIIIPDCYSRKKNEQDHFEEDENISVTDLDLYKDLDEDRDKDDISIFSNIDELHLKDYSDSISENNKEGYIKVTLNNNKHVVIKKSTLCWFFSSKNSRLSSDRIQRVKGMTPGKLVPKRETRNRGNDKIKLNSRLFDNKCKRKTRMKPKVKNRTKKNTSIVSSDSDDTSENTIISISLRSDTESDIYTDEENRNDAIRIETEAYYAIYYDTQWYLGRVIEKKENTCIVKFLILNLDTFIWPKKDDIQEIDINFIFHGPIQLLGSGPFLLKRNDNQVINKKYREFKKQT